MLYHLMTMETNGIEPRYHGLVEIDDSNLIQGKPYDDTPVEDYGCYYYTPENEPFPTDSAWMFEKFLSLMSDRD